MLKSLFRFILYGGSTPNYQSITSLVDNFIFDNCSIGTDFIEGVLEDERIDIMIINPEVNKNNRVVIFTFSQGGNNYDAGSIVYLTNLARDLDATIISWQYPIYNKNRKKEHILKSIRSVHGYTTAFFGDEVIFISASLGTNVVTEYIASLENNERFPCVFICPIMSINECFMSFLPLYMKRLMTKGNELSLRNNISKLRGKILIVDSLSDPFIRDHEIRDFTKDMSNVQFIGCTEKHNISYQFTNENIDEILSLYDKL